MSAPSSDFPHTLRAFRLQAGLSQEALAERSGISTRAISDMERGLRKRPYPDTIRRIAIALKSSGEDRADLLNFGRLESTGTSAVSPERGFQVPLALPTLPRPIDSLVGREAERATLVDIIERRRVRLVTLVGPGGVGKTRLSLEVAAESDIPIRRRRGFRRSRTAHATESGRCSTRLHRRTSHRPDRAPEPGPGSRPSPSGASDRAR